MIYYTQFVELPTALTILIYLTKSYVHVTNARAEYLEAPLPSSLMDCTNTIFIVSNSSNQVFLGARTMLFPCDVTYIRKYWLCTSWIPQPVYVGDIPTSPMEYAPF
jgi:hypothetical protein